MDIVLIVVPALCVTVLFVVHVLAIRRNVLLRAKYDELVHEHEQLRFKTLSLTNKAESMRLHKTNYSFSGTVPQRHQEVHVNEQLEQIAQQGQTLRLQLEGKKPATIVPDEAFREIGGRHA